LLDLFIGILDWRLLCGRRRFLDWRSCRFLDRRPLLNRRLFGWNLLCRRPFWWRLL
jgi:hypothetical protein